MVTEFGGYPTEPPPVGLDLPVPVIDPALMGLTGTGYGSDSWKAAVADRRARRQQRVQMAVAGLAGAVVMAAWYWAVDRRG